EASRSSAMAATVPQIKVLLRMTGAGGYSEGGRRRRYFALGPTLTLLQELADDVPRRPAVGLGLEVQHQPVREHRRRHAPHVVDRGDGDAARRGPGLGPEDEELRGPGPRAPGNVAPRDGRRFGTRPRGAGQPDGETDQGRGRGDP